jgi:hypothetical protein
MLAKQVWGERASPGHPRAHCGELVAQNQPKTVQRGLLDRVGCGERTRVRHRSQQQFDALHVVTVGL